MYVAELRRAAVAPAHGTERFERVSGRDGDRDESEYLASARRYSAGCSARAITSTSFDDVGRDSAPRIVSGNGSMGQRVAGRASRREQKAWFGTRESDHVSIVTLIASCSETPELPCPAGSGNTVQDFTVSSGLSFPTVFLEIPRRRRRAATRGGLRIARNRQKRLGETLWRARLEKENFIVRKMRTQGREG